MTGFGMVTTIALALCVGAEAYVQCWYGLAFVSCMFLITLVNAVFGGIDKRSRGSK